MQLNRLGARGPPEALLSRGEAGQQTPAGTSVPKTMSDVERVAYSPAEAAAALGIDRSTIYEWLNAQRLRSVKIGGRRLIAADELRRLVTEGVAS